MLGVSLLLAQGILYFLTMASLFRARGRLGIGVFVCALGVMHFLETYLAAVFFIPMPFGLISPGSTIMFSGKLMMLLLFYIRMDAETVRQPIYGLLIGNLMIVVLAYLLRYMPAAVLDGRQPDLSFLDQMGVLMVWGTVLLFIDSIALILLYEKLGKSLTSSVFVRAFIGAACVLTFDQLGFYAVLHWVAGVPISALLGGWIAKMIAAIAYSAMLAVYLNYFERDETRVEPERLADVFDRLTYRQRYEDLLRKAGIDQLTGARDRGDFETAGQLKLEHARTDGRELSLAMIDIDHFKLVNDGHGHVVGDEVLRNVAQTLLKSIRSEDSLFRYGGEEFALICEGLPHSGALALAERLRLAVLTTPQPAMLRDVTISIGVATFPHDGETVVDLVRHADANLYKAKQLGRNRVVGRSEEAAG